MKVDKSNIKNVLANIPTNPGVYQYLDKKGEIIYVGKAKNLHRRVNSYFNREHDSLKTNLLVRNIAEIKYTVVDSEQDAFILENNLIKEYKPKYNILLKDGKTYPCICITNEPYPRVFKTRNIIKNGSEYYGPYTFNFALDLVLDLIHNQYPIRTCKTPITIDGIEKNKYKVCLEYHIKKCCGVCEAKESREQYLKMIDEIRKIIKGDANEISKSLLKEMKTLADNLEFEKANELKKKYDAIELFKSKTIIANLTTKDADVFGYDEDEQCAYISMLKIHNGAIIKSQIVEYKKNLDEKEKILSFAINELRQQLQSTTREILVPFLPDITDENAHYYIPQRGDGYKVQQLAQENVKQYIIDKLNREDRLNPEQKSHRLLKKLQKSLSLNKLPLIIECFDNSNIMGQDAVAGCVVFKNAKPSKQDYRKYIIKTVEGADDYASMREVVERRYSRIVDEQGELPNLIIADGGIGQMHAIKDIVIDKLHLDIPIAGLKKDDRHRTANLLFGFPPQEISIDPRDELFKFLTQIQDEVHRYAITFHKTKSSKRQVHSELDEIKGIGEKTKKELLRAFKSLKRAKSASVEELEKVVGKSKASILYKHFNNNLTA